MSQFFRDDFWKEDAIPLPGTSAATSRKCRARVHGFELDLPSNFAQQHAQKGGPSFDFDVLWRPASSYFQGLPRARKDSITPDERKAYDGRVGFEINGTKRPRREEEARKRNELELAGDVRKLFSLEDLLDESPRKRFKR